jgi:hypothetical protein
MHVEEWGADLYLRVLTLRERQELASLSRAKNADPISVSLRIFTACVVDENGETIFNGKDDEALLGKNGEVMERVTSEILRVNGLGDTAVEDAEKN